MWRSTSPGATSVLPIIWELAEKLEPKHGIRIRKMSRLHLRRDLDAFAEIYNEAWSRNFGLRALHGRGRGRLRARSCSSSSTATGS